MRGDQLMQMSLKHAWLPIPLVYTSCILECVSPVTQPPKSPAANINASWRKGLIKTNDKSACTAALVCAAIALSACSNNSGQSVNEARPATDALQVEISAGPLSLNDQIALSKQDLAQRQSKDGSSITLVAARKVTWRSGALGCAGPGANYTQALVPGVLIVLQAGDEYFSYHAGNDGIPFYCPRERAEAPASIEAEDLA